MTVSIPVRKNYDKPNRCPGWSEPGLSAYPWERGWNVGCPDGTSGYYEDGIARGYRRASFSFHRCAMCGTRTWPWALRYIDPQLLVAIIKAKAVTLWLRWRRP